MRPSRRLLLFASLIALFSLGVIAVPAFPAELILAAWVILVAVVLADVSMTPSSKRFRLEAPDSRELFVGETTTLDFGLVPLGSSAQPATGSALMRIAWPSGLTGPQEFRLTRSEAGALSASVVVKAVMRGQLDLVEVCALRVSRLGLIELVAFYPCATRISVVPNVRSITSGAIDAEIAALSFGERTALTRGEGSEFHQLRDFVAGMDTRTIDYKRSARHGSLVAREMRAERNNNIVLSLDNGHLMREEIDGLAKIDHMIRSALALGWAGIQGGDLVGLFAFDARPRLFLPPGGGRRAFAQLRSRTADLEYRSVETNHTLAMTHLGQRLNRRSLVVVFSDFVDTTTAELLVENVQVLVKHHVVIFVSIRDPLLNAYARQSAHGIEDVASAVAAAGIQRDRRMVLERLGKIGVFVIDADPGQITAQLISTYLTIKARELV
ncbi:DUF58 domain-containing protein [Fulvimarina sp. MAC8]|uniref:DUF58 domain-containing protein n=1 Tax=Fulvimarina sp. MAC8 TaxID=3162874 RepID=UPI0032ECBC0D